MRSIWFAIWIAAIVAFGPAAHAAHPLTTDDTGTQGAGASQLELLVERSRDRSAAATVRGLQLEAAFSYGVSDAIDLQVGLPYLRQRTDDAGGRTEVRGESDASLGLKWRFLERDPLSLALKPALKLDNGDETRGLGSGLDSANLTAILSIATEPVAWHAHLSYQRNRNTVAQRRSLWQVAGAAAWTVATGMQLVAELTSETNSDRSLSKRLDFLQLGVIWSPRRTLDLDLGWRHGLNGAATDQTLRGGVTLRW